MKHRLAFLLFVASLWTAGCAQMSGMMPFDGTSDVPDLTEPELTDE